MSDESRSEEARAIELASLNASFKAVRRNTAVGVITGVVVVGAILLAADVMVTGVVAFCVANLLVRLVTVSCAQWGLRQTTHAGRQRAMSLMELSLVPMGALSGGSTLLVSHPEGEVNPYWFGLMLCAAAVGAASVMIGHGRSRTFLSLALPLILFATLSAALMGGLLGGLLAFGSAAVGVILMLGNREAGAIYRDAQRYLYRNQTLVAELEAANARLQELAHHDQLTGIANRTGLASWVDAHLDRTTMMAVVFVDLDGFKKLNDRFGHSAGDRALREIARRLTSSVRSDGIVARFGGDEFIALIEVDDERASSATAERITMCFLDPVDLGIETVTVEASVGLVVAHPSDDLVSMVELADVAMYDEKRERRATAGA